MTAIIQLHLSENNNDCLAEVELDRVSGIEGVHNLETGEKIEPGTLTKWDLERVWERAREIWAREL